MGEPGGEPLLMKVIAHRANLAGKEPKRENLLEQVQLALDLGFGIETDIRWAGGQDFYISHDAAVIGGTNDAVQHAARWRAHPGQIIALNVKELGCEQPLVEFLRQAAVLDQVFLFDMELLEASPGRTAREYARLCPALRLAARVSDRQEPLEQALAIREANIIWLDEFDRLWATAESVARLKGAGKTVYAVSPELHGFSVDEARARWDDFARWGVDGICTDYASALNQHLGSAPSRPTLPKETQCSSSS